VAPDNSVTVLAKHLEMGQGSYTGLATIVAEELDADWAQMRVDSAPSDAKLYNNLAFGTIQGTGGSTEIANSWMQLRQAGAAARAMLVAAAAADWNAPAAEIAVHRGVLGDAASRRRACFGELAGKAAAQPLPTKVALKDPKDFKLIGQKLPRVDVPAKSNGTAQFTLDVTFPGMLVAVLQRPPLFGATVKFFDATAAKAVPGVVGVVQVPRGVAVVGKSFWAAKKGHDGLKVDWDDAKAEKRSSAAIIAEYRKLVEQPGKPARREGDVAGALQAAVKSVSASYEFPYLTHAPMEPLDAVVRLDANGCEIWAGDQFQTIDQANAAVTAGMKPEQVKVHTLYAGGSFGRRANAASDYIVEAVSIAKALGANGVPVKLQWTREDDIRGGLYRPAYVHKLEAGLDAQGKLVGWRHRIVGQSIMAGTPFAQTMVKAGVDGTSVEGVANLPYAIPNLGVELTTVESPVPVLWWRVVGSSHTAYAVEAFIDEVADAAGQDSLSLPPRASRPPAAPPGGGEGWLGSAAAHGPRPRHRRRRGLQDVCRPGRRGDGRRRWQGQGRPLICGVAVNPDVIAAQLEGGSAFGLGAALYGAITLKDGQVEKSNFDSYPVLRIDDMPKVEVYIVPSTEAPTGVGEPGVAPIGPAVANAAFAATGKRHRVLPFAAAGTA
jgi:isoquinoline 1-oxidoreductase beta subunit